MTEQTLTITPRSTTIPRARRPRPTKKGVGYWVLTRSAGLVLLFAVWEILPRLGLFIDRRFLPPISEIAVEWWSLAVDGTLWHNTQVSLVRSFSGLAIAIAIGVPLGLFIGWYRLVSDVLSPVLELARNTAALALLPVFTLLLGIGQESKVALIAWACTWPLLLSTQTGVRNVDPLLVKSARSMGLGSFRLFQKVVLRAALPNIFTGLRLAGAASILLLIASETIGATSGLGFFIENSQGNFQIHSMYAGILTISILGLLLNFSLIKLERTFSKWKTDPR